LCIRTGEFASSIKSAKEPINRVSYGYLGGYSVAKGYGDGKLELRVHVRVRLAKDEASDYCAVFERTVVKVGYDIGRVPETRPYSPGCREGVFSETGGIRRGPGLLETPALVLTLA